VRRGADGRHINWTTSHALADLADLAGQNTFHSDVVEVRLVSGLRATPPAEAVVAD
jgi:hypothetical protein